MTKTELAGLIDPGLSVIARTARKPYRCTCADEYLELWAITTDHGGGHTGTHFADSLSEMYRIADAQRARYPGAKVNVELRRNRNYPDRAPDCLGDIPVGTAYVEYLGEAGAYQSGSRYCQRCGVKVWGKRADRQPS